jgi:DNA-directed RNA polymerase delta subunit
MFRVSVAGRHDRFLFSDILNTIALLDNLSTSVTYLGGFYRRLAHDSSIVPDMGSLSWRRRDCTAPGHVTGLPMLCFLHYCP